MGTIYSIYDQIAELIALLDPDKILSLKANEETQKRFNYLLEKHRQSSISTAEKDELDHFIVMERLIRLAKIRVDKG